MVSSSQNHVSSFLKPLLTDVGFFVLPVVLEPTYFVHRSPIYFGSPVLPPQHISVLFAV